MVRELSESGEQMNLSRELRFKLWLEQQMPSSLRGELLGVKYWHWLAMLVLIALGVVLDQAMLFIVHKMADSIARQRDLKLDRDVRRASLRPIGFLAMGLLWWYGLDLLSFSFSTKAYVILSAAVKIVVGAAGIWAIYRLIDLLGGYLAAAAQKTESRYDDLLVPLLRKTLKIGVTVIGFVYVAEVFQLPVKTLLTSLGIGGLAIGFAAREVLQNFFGSITVLLDRPFHIGDWIRTGDVEGTVEGVGFRSTRVRTFYNSLITVPNGALLTAKVDNLGARRYRRISTKLSLTYDTPPEKIDAFCEGIREIIRQHPYTRKDYYHVYFNEFDDASLNVLLYCFHEAPDWGTELRERHRLFSDILRLAKQLEVEFAFPTQTIHLFQEAKDEGSQDKPLPSDPGKVGREKAGEIIKKGGLHGAVPPPVSFDPLQSRATQTIGGTGDEETG
jgi:MscS family membrane protein